MLHNVFLYVALSQCEPLPVPCTLIWLFTARNCCNLTPVFSELVADIGVGGEGAQVLLSIVGGIARSK